jgi:dTDP-4-amino-4,6-dideoxygalactose transaminase
LGPETEAFEHEFANFVKARHCIGVSSGTTALHLALLALGIGPGDEVITVSNTCVPTIAAIELCGARPVLVDVRDEDLMMDADLIGDLLTEKTKCIVPVHLWGQSADMERIDQIAKEEGLLVVEDCAQAHGTLFNSGHVGTFGNAGCFSFYPTKNLGAYGEAGAIVTNDDELAARLYRLRVYGYDAQNCAQEKGMNARISEMQAAILRVKLRFLPRWLKRRREIAALYNKGITHPQIEPPCHHPERVHSFHQYVVRCRERDKVIHAVKRNKIGFGIHYPVPIHCMLAYKDLNRPSSLLSTTEKASNEILSLPIHEALLDEEVGRVIDTVCERI